MRLSTSTNILDCELGVNKKRVGIIESLNTCAEAGFKVFDMNFCDNGLPDGFLLSDTWESEVCHIYEESQKLGIEFSQSHLEFYNICDMQSSNANREVREELVRRGIIASGMLGAKWAVLHLGTVYENGMYKCQKSKEKNMEYVKYHLETAKRYGVGLAIENLPDKERRRFTGAPEELLDFVDTVNAEHLGICWDFGHGNLMHIDQAAVLREIGKRLKAVHVADNHGIWDEHMAPFCGTVDWNSMMQVLKEIQFAYDFTYEIHNMTNHFPLEIRKKQLEHLVDLGNYLLSI